MSDVMKDIMKVIDENQTQKKQNIKGHRSDASSSGSVRAKCFCCAFKLGFLELICKASLIFKSNFRVSFINYFKTKRIIWVKACCDGVQMFTDMRVVILLDMFLNPSFKIKTSFTNKARTSATTSKFMYLERF